MVPGWWRQHLAGGSSRSQPAWTSCSSLVVTGSAGAVSRLAAWEGCGFRGPGRGAGQPLGGVAGTHGSTSVLRYAPLRPINIITALKPLQFVSDLQRRNRRPSWPCRATPTTPSLPSPLVPPPPICSRPAGAFCHCSEDVVASGISRGGTCEFKTFTTHLLRLFRGTVCKP